MYALWWLLVGYLLIHPIILLQDSDYLLVLSFYLNAIPIAYMSYLSTVRNVGGAAFATINVYALLFLYVAPIYQIIEYPGYLINNYSPTLGQMLGANLLIFAFLVIFLFTYMRRLGKAHAPLIRTTDEGISSVLPVLIALAAAMAFWGVLLTLGQSSATVDDTVSGIDIAETIRSKVALVIPFAVLGLYLFRQNRRRSLLAIGALVLFVLMSKNIALDRRNSLGPIYLALFFMVIWRWRISSRAVFALVGGGLLFVFPVISIFINNPINEWSGVFSSERVGREISGHFVDMHYDSWASVVAGLQYVKTEGFQLGNQLLGALLFFLPRSIWIDKPSSTGETLGEYLVVHSNLWFTNISAPLPLEGYVDFGIIGVVAYAIAIAFYAQRLDYFVARGNAMDKTSALYFSFYLTFVMRGAFLPAFAYGVGAYLALNVLPATFSWMGIRSRRGEHGATASPSVA